MSEPPPESSPHASSAPPPPALPRRVVTARVAGILVMLITVGFGALSVTGQFLTAQTSQTQVFGPQIQRLVVVGDTGDVKITVDATRPLTVTTRREFAFGRPVVDSAVDGSTLRVTQDCVTRWWLPGGCTVDVEVTAPPGVGLDLTTSTGDVRVRNPSAALVAATETGDIGVTDAESDTIRLTAETGDVSVEARKPPRAVFARAETGDVRVTVPDDGTTYLIRASSQTGDVKVPEAVRNGRSERLLEAVTETGDVTVRLARTPR